MRLRNWTATPSGGAITISGTNEQGRPAKIRGVVEINFTSVFFGLKRHASARDRDRRFHELV